MFLEKVMAIFVTVREAEMLRQTTSARPAQIRQKVTSGRALDDQRLTTNALDTTFAYFG